MLRELESLRGEASVVVVVPTSISTGPAAAALHDYEVRSVGAVNVDEDLDPSRDGSTFLFDIAARRLGVARVGGGGRGDTTAYATRECVKLSGGLIRTFLQLLQKAALYATMRGDATPSLAEVAHAARDQSAFLLRLLKEGDRAALVGAHETFLDDVESERRIRFLANGLLLEYRTATGPIIRIAPLLREELLGEAA